MKLTIRILLLICCFFCFNVPGQTNLSFQLINVGTSANSGTGDTLRSGGQKINSNFQSLSNWLWGGVFAGTFSGSVTNGGWFLQTNAQGNLAWSYAGNPMFSMSTNGFFAPTSGYVDNPGASNTLQGVTKAQNTANVFGGTFSGHVSNSWTTNNNPASTNLINASVATNIANNAVATGTAALAGGLTGTNAVLYVDTFYGTASGIRGQINHPYSSLVYAVSNALPGDSITYLNSGTDYIQGIVLPQNCVVNGNGSTWVYNSNINYTAYSTINPMFVLTNGDTIENFIAIDTNTSSSISPVRDFIYSAGATNAVIRHGIIGFKTDCFNMGTGSEGYPSALKLIIDDIQPLPGDGLSWWDVWVSGVSSNDLVTVVNSTWKTVTGSMSENQTGLKSYFGTFRFKNTIFSAQKTSTSAAWVTADNPGEQLTINNCALENNIAGIGTHAYLTGLSNATITISGAFPVNSTTIKASSVTLNIVGNGIQSGSTNVSSATSIQITLPANFQDTNYVTSFTGNGFALSNAYVSSKTTNSFTINCASATGIIDWSAIHP